jgi:hypothetical protein
MCKRDLNTLFDLYLYIAVNITYIPVFAPCINLFACWFVLGATAPQLVRASYVTRFLGHTQRRTTVSRTPLDE